MLIIGIVPPVVRDTAAKASGIESVPGFDAETAGIPEDDRRGSVGGVTAGMAPDERRGSTGVGGGVTACMA